MGGFEALVAAFIGRDRVTIGAGRGFGGNALAIDGRIFAMPNEAGLVLKLPAGRVAALRASGDGLPFDAGKGRPLQQWVVVPQRSDGLWTGLAEEVLAFVGSQVTPRPGEAHRRQ
jgi:hypothetical protein